jgi:hypothetical protein
VGGSAASAAGAAASSDAASEAEVETSPCERVVDALEHGGHCYVLTPGRDEAWAAASARCAALARGAYLLVLNDATERNFVTSTLLDSTSEPLHLWLGYSCVEREHPDFASCYCRDAGCDLTGKRGAWSAVPRSFVNPLLWRATEPAGDGRCAALAPGDGAAPAAIEDRACGEIVPISGAGARYATVCEFE